MEDLIKNNLSSEDDSQNVCIFGKDYWGYMRGFRVLEFKDNYDISKYSERTMVKKYGLTLQSSNYLNLAELVIKDHGTLIKYPIDSNTNILKQII